MYRYWAAAAALLSSYLSLATNTSAVSNNLLLQRDDDDFDPDDLSFIKRIAAIGDSYSAGIGAGDRIGTSSDWWCSRYDHSYPYLIHQDERLGGPNAHTFQYLSCSGAVVEGILKQAQDLDSNQDIILISAGGNDAQLVDILNQCVFQYATFEWDKFDDRIHDEVKRRFGDRDWSKYGKGCGQQLSDSVGIIKSQKFASDLDGLISKAKEKLAPGGKIYYTGYAKFWSENYDSGCDSVTWAIWTDKVPFLAEALLSSANRRIMNDLVDMMNQVLEAAVARAGPSVEFVNYDSYVGTFGGRYCEPGVDEGDWSSNTRFELMFFELKTSDIWGSAPWKRDDKFPLGNGTFEAEENELAELRTILDADSIFKRSDHTGEGGHLIKNSLGKLLPDGIGRAFHPQIKLHSLIRNLVLWRIANHRMEQQGWGELEETGTEVPSCAIIPNAQLNWKQTAAGQKIANGRKLRILPVGDSITFGYGSNEGGDGDGYRRQLKNDLSANEVVFAGTERTGTMSGGYFAAWGGKTIQFISDNIDRSLDQRPNLVLVAAGTNDMNPDGRISTEGNDPAQAVVRLGRMIDKIIQKCPDATILVAMIINTCDPKQSPATQRFQSLIPGLVQQYRRRGEHVLAVNFASFSTGDLRDCIHPTNDGYKIMGNMWYDFITQIPPDWIKDPVGNDPMRDERDDDITKNGGIDSQFSPPQWQMPPMLSLGKAAVKEKYNDAAGSRPQKCSLTPSYYYAGKVALGGVGQNGDWKYHKNWQDGNIVAEGLNWGNDGVRLHDMNGDGKADYVWVHPETGEIRCWINNLPNPWSPAGNNNAVIGSGVGPGKTIFLADMNGDGLDDYLVVDPDKGSVKVWWNWGPDPNWVNGWKFEAGGEIASGVPHANLATLRFPDINGDGRADYVVMGQNGALKCFLNLGTVAGIDPIFYYQGTIASGAELDLSRIVFADMNGDGRDDYLIWDDDGGLSGFLNKPTGREGVPVYINQGGAKQIADGVHQPHGNLRLADMDGDGKDDYIYVADRGALHVWYNRGETDDNIVMDNIRFANLKGFGGDDYIYIDPKTGAPKLYYNTGPNDNDELGWLWDGQNNGNPIAAGAGPGHEVQFGDLDGDGYDDYFVIDSKTGKATCYGFEPDGAGEDRFGKFLFTPVGVVATGLGPGKNVRLADIDGDGRDDYIYLNKTGGAIVYLNRFDSELPKDRLYTPTPQADAFGIGQRPEEISFHDIDGDGKADYIWTRPLDGQVVAWLNRYPKMPAWDPMGIVRPGEPSTSHNVLWAQLTTSGRSEPVKVDVDTGAIAPLLSTCLYPNAPPEIHNRISILTDVLPDGKFMWSAIRHPKDQEAIPSLCNPFSVGTTWVRDQRSPYPPASGLFKSKVVDASERCYYTGPGKQPGRIICADGTSIKCRKHPQFGEVRYCLDPSLSEVSVLCEW